MRQKGEGKEEEGGEWRQEGRRMGKDERGRGRREVSPSQVAEDQGVRLTIVMRQRR